MASVRPSASPLLDIDVLRTFVTVAETGSFTRAARDVLRTPSAVSMQIKKLETMLGRPMFVRTTHAVRLTADGEALLGYGRRLLKLNEEAVARFLAPEVEGVVRFGAPDDYCTRFMPNILKRFAATHPHVQIDVVFEPSFYLMRRLDAGELDLALITPVAGDDLSGRGEVVYTEPLAWLGLHGGTAHRRAPLTLALADESCAWRAEALAALDRTGMPYRIAYSSPNTAGLIAALLADFAVSPLPVSLARSPLRKLDVDEKLPPLRDFRIILQRSPRAGAAAEVFAAQVGASFREVGLTMASMLAF